MCAPLSRPLVRFTQPLYQIKSSYTCKIFPQKVYPQLFTICGYMFIERNFSKFKRSKFEELTFTIAQWRKASKEDDPRRISWGSPKVPLFSSGLTAGTAA
jgi:hypothetical protein